LNYDIFSNGRAIKSGNNSCVVVHKRQFFFKTPKVMPQVPYIHY
jgi:hypothetical protein